MNKHGELFVYYMANYGWIFVFFFVAFSLIWYFGVYPFALFGNMQCNTEVGFICSDPEATIHEISFQLQNQLPHPVQLSSIGFTSSSCSAKLSYDDPIMLEHGEKTRVSFTCIKFPKIIDGELDIAYQNLRSGLSFTHHGDLRFVR